MTAHDCPTGSDDHRPGTGVDDPGPGDPGAEASPARLRFPGGRLGPADWTALAGLAAAHSGELRLLPRGEVQITGMRHQDGPGEPAEPTGDASTVARGRAHRILASPLAGKLDGRADLGDLPERLDAALAARAEPAAPAGDLLFGFDDGSGDVLSHCPDLAVVAVPGDGPVRIHVGGRDAGLETPIADIVTVLVDAAARWAGGPGRSAGSPDPAEVHDLVVVDLIHHPLTTRTGDTPAATRPAPTQAPPVGWIDTLDGHVTLLAVVPDDVVPARLAEFLGAVERPGTISADRVIGLHGLTEVMAEQVVRVLAPMGMVFDAASPWVGGRGSA